MNVRTFDMNLLKVFRALATERSVSRAAARLNLTQSAVSASLSRLRRAFNDDLFSWNGRTMVATPKAEAIMPRIQEILDGVLLVLDEAQANPASAKREFVIASFDYIEGLLGPLLLERLCRLAPNITIDMVDATPEMYTKTGARGVDLLILPAGFVSPGSARAQKLFRDSIVCIAAANNERAHAGMSREEFLQLPRVMFSATPRQTLSIFASTLLDSGINLESRLRSSHLTLLPLHVAVSDCIAVVPERVAVRAVALADIKVFQPPITTPTAEITMYWQPMHEKDPVHQWLRATIVDLTRELGTRNPVRRQSRLA